MSRIAVQTILLLSILAIAPSVARAEWILYEETSIAGTVSGSVKKGHIFKTRSGNIYEVTEYVYMYEYEYSPDVMVLRSGDTYRLIIDGFDDTLDCRLLNASRGSGQLGSGPSHPRAISIAQASLKALGFDPGEVDGSLGPKTRAAIRAFQASVSLGPTGNLDAATLKSLAAVLYRSFPDESKAADVAVELLAAAEGGPPVPSLKSGGCETGHWISEVLNSGRILKLEDGSIWEVDPVDTVMTIIGDRPRLKEQGLQYLR